jgi:predicted component of type VI protein secretion system
VSRRCGQKDYALHARITIEVTESAPKDSTIPVRTSLTATFCLSNSCARPENPDPFLLRQPCTPLSAFLMVTVTSRILFVLVFTQGSYNRSSRMLFHPAPQSHP